MKNLFLIIGAPGSGKTTDAKMIADRNDGFTHFSTGDLLRAEIESGSELGNQIDDYVKKGNLVPLEVVIKTIISAIHASSDKNVIIDGYPRSTEQMLELHKVLQNDESIKLISVIEVFVGEDVAKERVLGRNRGADDNEEVFKNRMQVYSEPLNEIRDFYNNKGLLKTINGEREIQPIVDDIEAFVLSKI